MKDILSIGAEESSAKDDQDKTPLEYALEKNDGEMIKVVIGHTTNLDLRRRQGKLKHWHVEVYLLNK